MRVRKPCWCFDCILARISGAKRCELCAHIQREKKRADDRHRAQLRRDMAAYRARKTS